MSISAISSKVVSTLGNPNSLVPLMVKDGVDSASLTYYSYKAGGKVEGTDRALDEFGTQAIWIGGIPFFKKLIDKTAYKAAKLNPAVDPRIIADKDYSAWAVKNAKGLMSNAKQTVKDALQDSLVNVKKTKGLYMAKVAAATALTLISYFTLTKAKQKITKNRVEKEVIAEQPAINVKATHSKENQKFLNEHYKNNVAFNAIENFSPNQQKTAQPKTNPAFKGLGKSVLEGIMFNPVHNMKLIDAGITTERLAQSRNKTEFTEHAIKEGIFLFFMYGLGNVLQKGINAASKKFLKKPIDLDIQVLMSKELKNSLPNGKLAQDLAKVPGKESKITDVLDFVVKNPDNIVVQSAKKAGIVSTVGKTLDVDTSKYISKDAIHGLTDNLKNIGDSFKNSGETVEKFLKKTKGLKVASVMTNLVACCFVLGYVVPNVVYKYRKDKTGTTDFHVANDIKKAEEEKLKKA
ncbi:MAG: hypothetical protein PHV37_01160 [Candidatus Gastranaerophilales bacterium]|nr:hypothetical protein [Candidatus Gastranaerophilales bacterium]